MKKLLSLLGAIGIIASSSVSVIACGSSPTAKNWTPQMVADEIEQFDITMISDSDLTDYIKAHSENPTVNFINSDNKTVSTLFSEQISAYVKNITGSDLLSVTPQFVDGYYSFTFRQPGEDNVTKAIPVKYVLLSGAISNSPINYEPGKKVGDDGYYQKIVNTSELFLRNMILSNKVNANNIPIDDGFTNENLSSLQSGSVVSHLLTIKDWNISNWVMKERSLRNISEWLGDTNNFQITDNSVTDGDTAMQYISGQLGFEAIFLQSYKAAKNTYDASKHTGTLELRNITGEELFTEDKTITYTINQQQKKQSRLLI